MSDCDVLVVGAGPAGSAAAIALSRAGLRVIGTDGDRPERGWAGESVSPGIEAVMTAAFGPRVLREPPHAVAHGVRSAWGSSDLVEVDFLASPLGDGWHLDRAALDQQVAAVAGDTGVVAWSSGPVTGVSRDGDLWRVQCGREQRTSRRVIDATGRAGAVVGRLGVPRHRLDRQVAEVAVVEDVPSARVTTVESEADGWWYTTPLPQGGRVVVRLTDADLRDGASGDSSDFTRRLVATDHIAPLAGSLPDSVRVVPAGVTRLARLAGRGWAAAGDAAISWDPMSGQGVVTAVLMGSRLGEALATELAGGGSEDLRCWEADYLLLLAEHEQQRRDAARAETRWPESDFWRRRH